jgi:hypothetical protein
VNRALLLVTAALLVEASTTQVWEMNGYLDFAHGRFSAISITYDGRVSLARALTTVFDTGQAEVWSMAAAPDGSVYLGTGNRGRLFRVDTAGRNTLVWTSDQPEIFAVTVDQKGVVYAGSSPDGRVYRIENGKATEYFAPGAHYIWALALAPDGALMVATGDEGKIFRVTAAGQGSVYYETGQSHVTSLAFDAQGRLLAGSEPNGILYRITGAGKAFALYKSSLPEIHSIVPAPDGSIYAVAMGGGVAKRAGAAASGITSSVGGAGGAVVSTTVTVTEQENGITPAPKPEAPPKPVAVTPQTMVVAAAASTSMDTSTDKSALYRILPDNSVETLWTSREENVYDVALEGSAVVFLTDVQGKIYQLEGSNRATLLAQTDEGDSTRLLASNRGLLVGTGNLGKLLRLEPGAGGSGWYESPVKDAGAVAKWGKLTWRGDALGIAIRTRSGNSARPDETWSEWSALTSAPAQGGISSPNARFIQWRAEFMGTGGARPGLDDVTVAYLPQNSAPVIRALLVTGVSGSGAKAPAVDAQTIGHNAGEQIQVVWQAEDPDQDKLVYSLYFRGEDEKQWKLLRGNFTDSTYSIDGEALADGRYIFRVVASDRPSNPVETAREAELVSTAVTIDNTPPAVTLSGAARTGVTFQVFADAADRQSVLRRCEYAVDGGAWTPVEAEDGVTDSKTERFAIRVANLPAGEHMISVRVYDGAGNAGVAKVVTQ